MRGVTTSPPGQGLGVLVSKPDKSQLVYLHLAGAGQTLVTPPLPVTGSYTVFIEPESAAQGAATVAMELLLDPGRALVVDGPTLDTAIGVAGGSTRYLLAGTAGQNLGFGISNLALNPTADATVTIYKPDGAVLTAFTCPASAGGCGGSLANLPLSGTFGMVVRPSNFAVGGFSATLSSDLAGTLVAGGSALSLALDRPGRNARIVFAGTAGQTLRLTWSESRSQERQAARTYSSVRRAALHSVPSSSLRAASVATTFPRCPPPAATRCSSIRRRRQR